MCVSSMIMNHFFDKWSQPPYQPLDLQAPYSTQKPITWDEINEFESLLKKARAYDQQTNQVDCENEEKRQQLKSLARKLGMDPAFLNFL